MKRTSLVLATLVGLWTSPTAATPRVIGGAGGILNITVVRGIYDPDGPFGDGPVYDLSGLTGLVKFNSKVTAGVPRPYEPFGVFSPFYENSMAVDLREAYGFPLRFSYSGSNFEPDRGETFRDASFIGDADEGVFSLFVGNNNGPVFTYSLNYLQGGLVGFGSVSESEEDYRNEPFVRFDFLVSGGKTFAVVPEPASWAMMIVGFAVVGVAMRRSNRRRRVDCKLILPNQSGWDSSISIAS